MYHFQLHSDPVPLSTSIPVYRHRHGQDAVTVESSQTAVGSYSSAAGERSTKARRNPAGPDSPQLTAETDHHRCRNTHRYVMATRSIALFMNILASNAFEKIIFHSEYKLDKVFDKRKR